MEWSGIARFGNSQTAENRLESIPVIKSLLKGQVQVLVSDV